MFGDMSRRKRKDTTPADATRSTELEERQESAEPETEPAEGEPTPEELTPEQEAEKLRDENLRLMAELRNVGQRAEREKQEALKYAEAEFAKELLVVLDDFERTLESARTAENVQSVAEGVRIIYEHLLKVLAGRQIEPIEALGKPFDPSWHEAMLQQPSEEYPAKTVIQELSRGYKMHGRVIRPAKVIVSSGPPSASAEADSPE
jgi:molecular chaperone GrpE